jgi:predicted DNA-binding ArsR family transcriptional regulator
MGLVDRAFLLSHPDFHQKNLVFIVTVLLENDYPLKFIFETIAERIKSLINKKSLNKIVTLKVQFLKKKTTPGLQYHMYTKFQINSKISLKVLNKKFLFIV